MDLMIVPTYMVLVSLVIFLSMLLLSDRKEKKREVEINDAILGPEELKNHAVGIARNHIVKKSSSALSWLISRMNSNYRVIAQIYRVLNNDVQKNLPVPPSAEWLLDNFYVIEEEFKDIKQNIPWKSFSRLPVLKSGYLKGYPRIFAIALEIVSHTDGRIDENTIVGFIEAYQTQKVLSSEELWALAIMVRIALIENLRQICVKMLNTKKQWRKAEEIGDLIKNNLNRGKEEILWFLNEYVKDGGEIYSSFIEHLVKILKKQGRILLPIIKYIDEKLADQGLKSDDVAAFEHQIQAALQVSIGNSLTSLKLVQSMDWNEVFESLSYVESILRRDPANVYMKMDYKSKNYYRNSVNKLARVCNVSETLIALKALECAQEYAGKEKSPLDHIGYYILGKGKSLLLSKINCKTEGLRYLGEITKRYPAYFYLGTIVLFTTLITLLLSYYASYATVNKGIQSIFLTLLSAFVVIIPASEIAIALVNFAVSHICSPSLLPKLELKDGIPQEHSTMVIVPTLLPNEKRVNDLLEQLEVHYLANKEKNIYFALVGDFKDAASKNLPEDEKIIEAAIKGIKELNKRYGEEGKDIFYYFHRERQYNPVQKRWMGWERKRGAIIEVNDLLRGSSGTSYNVISCEFSDIPRIKYVITLDADTRMPIGTAKTLVGTIAHPMNRAIIDKKKGIVIEGYGIFQPRINISITSASISFFTKVFAGQGGIDPYTTAVSDVYQDLFGEGIFTGKGIYELDVFQEVLKKAIPENSVLSHDLLEGCYARACLVTDVELVDGYPARYNSFSMRLHRWVRGDWQLVPWLGRIVKDREGNLVRNPLSIISKWKIIDNMRRSLINPSLLLLIILGFVLLPGSGYVWLGLAVLTVTIYPLIQIIYNLLAGNYFKYRQGKYAQGMSPLKASLYQALLQLTFIPYQAYLMVDAIIRTIIRLSFTKKNMLEWVTAADMEASLKNDVKSFWKRMWMSSVTGVVFLFGTIYLNPGMIIPAFIISVPWIASFYIAYLISQPYVKKVEKPGPEDIQLLRKIARRTWGYFEDLVTEKDNFLPPDNYQEEPYKGIAHRTSPTNIGLMMASIISAKDLGYIGFLEMGMWLDKVVTTIEKMEKWEGHLYNWYNTNTLKVLRPAYVSTVDSGNFVGYLMVVRQAIEDILNSSPVDINMALGLKDILNIIKEEVKSIEVEPSIDNNFNINIAFLEEQVDIYLEISILKGEIDVEHWKKLLEQVISSMKRYTSNKKFNNFPWLDKLLLTAEIYKKELVSFLPLSKVSICNDYSASLDSESRQIIEEFIFKIFKGHKVGSLLFNQLPNLYEDMIKEIQNMLDITDNGSPRQIGKGKALLKELAEDIEAAAIKAGEFINLCNSLSERINKLINNVKFSTLYDKKRQLFYIGYDVEKNRFSKAYYDLLASESRQTSFIAIARGEVDKKHWFKLGRRLTMADDCRGLVSWTGTMFEYLMPLLIMANYENTLMDETYRCVVKTQKTYGRKRNIPWGVSESAYYAFDINLNYQYKAFGVPELGLKRGLVNDMVIAPYSTMLALNLDPNGTIENIHRLMEEGLYSNYGLYEAIDYTPSRLTSGQRGAIIKSFMAHHQGMSLLALNNYLNNNILQKRFHKNPSIKAAELLLQERVPYNAILTKGYKVKLVPAKRIIIEGGRVIRRFGIPDSGFPHMHILSNGKYSLMVTDGGLSYSKYNDIVVSRWKASLEDPKGSFIYVRDVTSDKVWSVTYEPYRIKPEKYRVVFSPDKAEFIRKDDNIETRMEIIVSTEEHSEIRRVSLTNYNHEPLIIETTSYMEVVLAHPDEDLAHPAFSKLFITTEFNPQYNCILAERRPKSQKDKRLTALHLVTVEGEVIGNVEYETDRAKFIGRNRSLANPQAMEPDQPLSNTTGFVLDPIMSIRYRVKIEPGKTVRLSYVTAISETHKEAIEIAEKYSQVKSIERAFELAWTRSQIESGYLGFKAEEIELYLKMLPHILIPGPLRRKWEDVILTNKKGQPALWAFGISGDIPILLLHIYKKDDIEIINKILKGHEYWGMKGVELDLVIITEDESGYLQLLQDMVKDAVASSHARELLGKRGGVFIISKNQITDEDVVLLYTAARLVLKGNSYPIEEQLEWERKMKEKSTKEVTHYESSVCENRNYVSRIEAQGQHKFQEIHPVAREVSPANQVSLKFFNGLGGFANDGKEYIIYLKNKQTTPAPWINVISNKNFGFIISESGGGYTWAENSRENKLTPWSNDWVTDNPGEIIYIRDNNAGKYWSMTPSPIRNKNGYIIKHGYGYSSFEHQCEGIQHELILFVPVDDPVKVSLVVLENKLDVERKLSLFYYIKPVLGVHEKNTSQYIYTSIDKDSGIFTVENPFNTEFAGKITFIDSSLPEKYVTGDALEFIGADGSLRDPQAIKRKMLSGAVGAGFDPCAAIQINVELEPKEKKELVFLLGQGKDMGQVINLCQKYRSIAEAKKEFEKVKELWDRKLGIIQVYTPDETMNVMLNGWILYQVISCRLWARSAFYQSGGAFGFRDQLQDVMALVYAWPELTREQIMLHSSRQFIEGDVQHWWHPETGRGIRTRYSDDLLWLPYVTADYITCTGDWDLLNEEITYIEDRPLDEDESERYNIPRVSEVKDTVYKHCIKAIEKALKFGEHGIPLIGSGDWNDGMNTVGNKGKGESIWLGWFLCTVMKKFIPICEKMGDSEKVEEFRKIITQIIMAIEENAWDGSWYRRAYFDDGKPLGSTQNSECRIDSVAQSWAAISGFGDKNRTREALNAVENYLVDKEAGLIKLFTPPFDKGDLEPGYIKGYVPGVRENGGQYTHAAIWVILAFAKLGEGDKAYELFSMINPINHSRTQIEAARYKTEPYVLAADVYAIPPNTGRGGWTWYTGAAGWMYRVGIEHILGIKKQGETLVIDPCIPADWSGYSVRYKYGKSEYEIRIQNPYRLNKGVKQVTVDSRVIEGNVLCLKDDGNKHLVEVILG
ncbi:MAG: glycosyl transferase [Firmicutes bacterium]|nr:glycosyl transferase [Bacillota bacterium]